MSSATSIGWISVGTCGWFERLTFFSPTIPHTNLCILVEQKACIGCSFPPESSVEEKGLESCMAVVTPVTSWTNRRGASAQAESHGPMRREHRGGAGYRTQTSHCCTTRENRMLRQSPPWWTFTGLSFMTGTTPTIRWFYIDGCTLQPWFWITRPALLWTTKADRTNKTCQVVLVVWKL